MKLFAVIVHLGGSSFSGHYYAFVRQGNLWYKVKSTLSRWMIAMYRSVLWKLSQDSKPIFFFMRGKGWKAKRVPVH